jgi:hypothetical protein
MLFLMAFALLQCRSKDEDHESENDPAAIIEENLGKTLAFEEMPDSLKAAHMVRVWNGCHSERYVSTLENYYDNQVFFYGENRPKWDCMRIKKALFERYPEYFQRIIGGIQVDYLGSNEYKCSFTKYVTLRKVTAPVPSYIIFRKTADGKFLIIAESDPQTDIRVKELKDSMEVLIQMYSPSESEVRGNFSGMPGQEIMYIMPPEQTPCNDCTTTLYFSNELLPPIDIQGAFAVNVLNEGDLDGDGADEFSLLPIGSSQSSTLTVYSFKRGQWVKLSAFPVNRRKLLEDVEARKNAVQLAGPGFIFVEEAAGDTVIQKKVDIWKY